ncbi:holo-[acyl-carrier-protein] synthase [Candidatus Thorarchaeota archaeon]|nr:MAG: holo-[acyl-carrier-protein] synthase [Candidatus Thorarchaeota archaeon]
MTDESQTSVDLQFGLGTDIVEIQRFRALDRDAPFFSRVFTHDELTYCRKHTDASPHFAATFAGKESVLKAMNSRRQLSISEIEILRDSDGAPYVCVEENTDVEVLVSLAHSEHYAVAVAIVIPKSQSSNVEMFRKLLNETIHDIIPGQ